MILLQNKKVHLEFEIEKTLSAGIILNGGEVKSLRNKSGSLVGSYVRIIGAEAFLINAQITPYVFADTRDYDPKRSRKLLLKKKEINSLIEVQEQKQKALVPIRFELEGRHVKLIIGIGKGLKKHEKREKIKKREMKREIQKTVRNY